MYKDRASKRLFSILLLNMKGQLRILRHLRKSSDTKDRKQNKYNQRNLKKTGTEGAEENYENVIITFRLWKEDKKKRAGQKEEHKKHLKSEFWKLELKYGSRNEKENTHIQ